MALVVVIVALGFALVPITARVSSTYLAYRAIQGEAIPFWKAACFASQFLFWSVMAVIGVGFVLIIQQSQILSDPLGSLLASGVVLAILMKICFSRSNFRHRYWEKIEKSLDVAIPTEGPRRTSFNEQHSLLLSGDWGSRNRALIKILDPTGTGRVVMTTQRTDSTRIEREDFEQQVQDVDERFRHYSGLATALSVTIIGLSGGLFYALMGETVLVDRIARGLLGLSVIVAVLLQFFHVRGYVHHARARHHFFLAGRPDAGDSEEHLTKLGHELDDSRKSFDRTDWCLRLAVVIQLLGLSVVGIGHI